MKITSMADLKIENKLNGGYWFSTDTMRFFKTRILTHLIYGDDKRGFFITSDKAGFSEEAGREFKIRVANLQTADVKTWGEPYATKAKAMLDIKIETRKDGEKWVTEMRSKGL